MSEELKTEDEIYEQIKERIKDDFVPLFHEDGKPAGVGYHKESKLVYRSLGDMVREGQYHKKYHTKEEEKSLNEARRRKWDEKSSKKEKEAFDKAEKIKFSEWPGEQFFHGDDFHIDIDDFLDSCFYSHDDNLNEYPKYVWATKPKPYITSKDAWEVYESDIEDLENGEYDWPVHGVEVLQMALDAFVDANKDNIAYWPDYSTALLIEDEIQKFKETINE